MKRHLLAVLLVAPLGACKTDNPQRRAATLAADAGQDALRSFRAFLAEMYTEEPREVRNTEEPREVRNPRGGGVKYTAECRFTDVRLSSASEARVTLASDKAGMGMTAVYRQDADGWSCDSEASDRSNRGPSTCDFIEMLCRKDRAPFER